MRVMIIGSGGSGKSTFASQLERLDLEFMKWVWNYRRTRKPAVEQKLAGYSKDKRIIVIKKTKEASDLLDNVRAKGVCQQWRK